MQLLYSLNRGHRPAVTYLNYQRRFSSTNSLIFGRFTQNMKETAVTRFFYSSLSLNSSRNQQPLSLRNFSSLARSEASVTKGDLFSRTARPLEDFKVDRNVTAYAEGLKSCRIFDNPNIVRVATRERETIFDKVYRYMDIGGFFTMFNSRKVHLLRIPAEGRASLMCFTEFERKQSLIMKAVLSLLLYYVYYCYVKHKLHIFDRHPSPDLPTFEFTNNRSKDFTWHGSLPFQYPKGRCKECRWLELECKKKCYDELLQQGHQFILQNPMQIPRRHLLPSPYPPAE